VSLTLTAKDDIILNQSISTTNGAINLTPGDDITGSAGVTVNSGSAPTKIELYDGGHIALGGGDCEENTCTLTLTSALLSAVTSTGLTIGGTKTDNIYVGGLTEAATANVSGTVTLNALRTDVYSQIIFEQNRNAANGDSMIYFKALTTNSTENTFLDGETTITVGDFNGKANYYDQSSIGGTFQLGTNITLTMSGGGDVTFTGDSINDYGIISGAGSYTTNGPVYYIDWDWTLRQAIEAGIDNAQNAQFLNELEEMVTGFIEAFAEGSNC
jgi:hypothetical protein